MSATLSLDHLELRLGVRADRDRGAGAVHRAGAAPWGRIRLGPDDSRPDFRTFSWVSMMFAAGLGAGLLFYGTAEPISHWSAPPHGLAEPQTEEAAKMALQYTYFHWGFNGWALYAVMGGAMAYFSFRKGAPTRPRPASRRESSSSPTSAPSPRSRCSSSSCSSAVPPSWCSPRASRRSATTSSRCARCRCSTGVGDEEWMASWTIFYWAWWISGRRSWHVRGPYFPRPDDPGVHDRRGCGADRVRVPVVRDRRGNRHRTAAHRSG